MSAYGTVARHVMAPMIDTLRNTHTMRCLQQLEQSQWWPRERLEELQNLRLQRLITHKDLLHTLPGRILDLDIGV